MNYWKIIHLFQKIKQMNKMKFPVSQILLTMKEDQKNLGNQERNDHFYSLLEILKFVILRGE